jgi:hypothetical protein
MKRKAKSYKHVTIMEQGGRFRLSWYSKDGQRHRPSFGTREEAERQADLKEEALERGFDDARLDTGELSKIIDAFSRIPKDVTLSEVIEYFLTSKNPLLLKNTTTLKLACDEFTAIRDKMSKRHADGVRTHIKKFLSYFTPKKLNSEITADDAPQKLISEITTDDINKFLKEKVPSHPKTQKNYIISICSLFHYAKDKGYISTNQKTAADSVPKPDLKKVKPKIHIFTPEEMTKLLAFTPTSVITWMVLGAFAGVREAERRLMTWDCYQPDHNQLVLGAHITKTGIPRDIELTPNLRLWLDLTTHKLDEKMCLLHTPQKKVTGERKFKGGKKTLGIVDYAGIPWKKNVLRHSYATYHSKKFDNLPLTSKNDGHSVTILQTVYRILTNKTNADGWFNITPAAVIAYCVKHNLEMPDWAPKETVKEDSIRESSGQAA